MVLDKQRGRANKTLEPIAKVFKNIEPNTLSAIAILFAVMAMICLWMSRSPEAGSTLLTVDGTAIIGAALDSSPYWLLAASFCILMNGFFDIMDGQVAKMTGKASVKGDFLDHVLDRYADILILMGVLLSGYSSHYIWAFGLIGVFMTSYMGTQAQALGVKRDYGGVLGRADRLALLFLIPILMFFHTMYFNGPYFQFEITDSYIFNWTLFDIMMLWFGVAGNLTALQRARRTWKVLSKRK